MKESSAIACLILEKSLFCPPAEFKSIIPSSPEPGEMLSRGPVMFPPNVA